MIRVTEIPEEVRALGAERERLRRARDFAAADDLRDRIGALGYRVIDGADGPTFERVEWTRPAARMRAADVPSVLEEAPTVDVSAHWVVQGWPEDVTRAIAALRDGGESHTLQCVVADATHADPSTYGEDVEVLPLEEGTGWAAASNAGLRRSRGRVIVAFDGSVEATGDLLGPLEAALADERTGVCGPFGISTRDLRTFQESEGPEVDAIEGYCMAFRREVLREVGAFDEKFRWYRTADIELSFRIKDAGYRAIVVDAPVTKHEHRMWSSTPPAERDRLSKRNFYRFLERFRDRFDLLVDAGE